MRRDSCCDRIDEIMFRLRTAAEERASAALLETFVEVPRFRGTCYRAANWTKVGQTQGRGRNDRFNEYAKPVKDIWLRPLSSDWRESLNA